MEELVAGTTSFLPPCLQGHCPFECGANGQPFVSSSEESGLQQQERQTGESARFAAAVNIEVRVQQHTFGPKKTPNESQVTNIRRTKECSFPAEV